MKYETPKQTELKLTRLIAATPAEVYDVWLDAKSPGGPWFGCQRVILDGKVDGLFYHSVFHEGRDWAHYGRFIALDRPRRIAHTWVSEATRGLESVVSLTFDSPATARYTDSSFASRPGSSQPTQQSDRTYSNTITVPAGTRLVVRTIDPVDSDKNHVGDKFEALLEQPLNVNDTVVAPKGASVYGRLDEVKQAGHITGKSDLKLSLTGIVINGQTVPLSTSDYDLAGKSRGANTAKKVGGGAAAGAVIGAIVGGGKGAAIGAGVGAGAGTAVQVMTRGQQVHVPSETLLEFTLDQSVTVTRAR